MPANMFEKAVKEVDWNATVEDFFKNSLVKEKISKLNLRLAIWSRQLEKVDGKNPAICFIREMQVEGQLVAMSIALATYKSAASAMRAIVESALYYTYFRTHPSELATLATGNKWYIEKSEILEYHKIHTPNFSGVQKNIPITNELNVWYSKISKIIHGQCPGLWHKHRKISDIKRDESLEVLVVNEFEACVEIVHKLFLCTIAAEIWDYFSQDAKRELIHGLSGGIKEALFLDQA